MVAPELREHVIGPRRVQRSIGVRHSVVDSAMEPDATAPEPTPECVALDRLLAAACDGVGGALVLRGESGTGGTISACAAGQAPGIRVIRAAGVRSEAGLRYAALHQLLLPFLSQLDRLPGPQSTALRAAFGLVEAAPQPGLFLASVAVLTLLSGLADEMPLLVAVDDGQWLDDATANVLAFVGRRLRRSSVALVVAVRESYSVPSALQGLPEVSVNGPSDRVSAPGVGAQELVVVRDPNTFHRGQAHSSQTSLRDALYAVLAAGRLAPSGILEDVTRAARAALTSVNRPLAAGELLLDGFVVRLTIGHPPAVPALRAGIGRLLGEEAGVRHSAGTLALASWAAGELLDSRAQDAVARRWAQSAHGPAEPDWPPITSSLPNPLLLPANDDLLGLAWRGDEEDARTAIADQVDSGIARGVGLAVTMAHYASTILELGLGHYDAALANALSVYQDDPPDFGTQVLPDLVEAAVRAGNRDAAHSALDRFSERAFAADTPLARGLLARSLALTAADSAAEDLYRQAVEELLVSHSDLQVARTRLLYGEWLRRRRRRRDARTQLTVATDTFTLAGAEAFARRARVEAEATGERIGKRTDQVVGQQLTPQEGAVARLVVEGSSNREVAVQLFISVNTVEYHLRKVFQKVGVSSRTQLTRTLLGAPRVSHR